MLKRRSSAAQSSHRIFTARRLRTCRLEKLESRQLLVGDLIISEFLASNDNLERDEDQNRTDWIELLNTGNETVDLDGWFLTDDADDLDKWRLPSVSLGPGQFQTIFASAKNRLDPTSELHTNFRLNAAGGYLALVEPDGLTVASDFGEQYPPQLRDVSYGIPHEVVETQALEPGSDVRWFVPTEENGGDRLELNWTNTQFDDTTWQTGTTGIGYERARGYDDFIGTDVEAAMYDVNPSIYLRQSFSIDDVNSIFSIELSMQYDDAFVAYLNGTEIARGAAPEEVTWNSESPRSRRDREAVIPETTILNVFEHPDLLKAGDNILAVHALNDAIRSNDFLIVPALKIREVRDLQLGETHYFAHPTFGEPNHLGAGLTFADVHHEPNVPKIDETLTVRTTLVRTGNSSPNLTLHYRSMFDAEVAVPMFDDGQHDDGQANDGVFAAMIPAGMSEKAQMIRYRLTADIEDQIVASSPPFQDPLTTRQYFGTVVFDESIQSNLHVFQLFLEDPDASETDDGTRGALFHDGRFYDNIEIDTTGRSIGLSGPKKSHDIFFTSDNWLQLGELRMNDFDIINDYWNRAKVRIPLGFETLRNIGVPAHLSFPARVDRNGEFFGTYSFVDGGNEQFLERAGIDPGGALYKMNLGFAASQAAFKKQTRNHEAFEDISDLFDGLKLEGEARRNFLFDNVNIPAVINYLVGLVAMGHGDCCGKNLYLYRDSEGSGEWEALPWDLDSAFGRGGAADARDIVPTAAGVFTGINSSNVLFDALMTDIPEFREMYLRRLRNVIDDVLQPPDTPQEELKFEKRIDELVEELEPDALLDFERWGSWTLESENDPIIHSHEAPGWMHHVNILKNDYFPARRTFIYRSMENASGQDIGPRQETAEIRFRQIDASPVSGNQDEEYIELINQGTSAVDISGWELRGGVSHTFRAGTVLTPGSSLFVSPNVNAFRARSSGPTGGQGLFIQGNYQGHISNHGATLQLTALNGTTIDEISTPAAPNAVQQFLRISEVMYHPRAADALNRFEAEDYEFVELVNTSDTESLNLEHVIISSGVQFDFPAIDLAPGERIVVVRDQYGFADRYGDAIRIAGEYGDTENDFKLSNGGELIRLEVATGDLIQEFTYDDTWLAATDGDGFSLTAVNVLADTTQWNVASGWRLSTSVDGSPGSDDTIDADFDQNGAIDVNDVDAFCSGLRSGDERFDFNADNRVNQADLSILIEGVLRTEFGDSNFDGIFDSNDLVLMFQANEYEDSVDNNSTWAEGDWNCDGDATSADIVLAFQMQSFQDTARQRLESNQMTKPLELSRLSAADVDQFDPAKTKRRFRKYL